MKNMTHVLFVVLLIMVFNVQIAYCQKDSLNDSQLASYNRLKLSVELYERGMGSVGYYGNISYDSWTQWVAYEGFKRISEEEFFNKAGYLLEAEEAASYHRTTNILMWGGLGLMATGVAIMLASGDSDGLLWGAVLALGGTVPGWMAIARLKSNWAPYSTVSGIAEQYNRGLAIKIRKGL